jgi:hypothetical protein
MKALLVLLLLAACPAFGQTTLDKKFTPFKTKVQEKLHALDDISSTATYATQEGHHSLRVAKVVYDVAADGGTIGARGLGVFLPAKALIKQAWFYVDTQFVDAGTGTVALSCEDANNIYTATDITGQAVGTVTSGAATGVAANMVKAIAAQCEITATVAGAAQTAGKLTLWVEYVVHN